MVTSTKSFIRVKIHIFYGWLYGTFLVCFCYFGEVKGIVTTMVYQITNIYTANLMGSMRPCQS